MSTVANVKRCPRCQELVPLAAFVHSNGKPKGVCLACNRKRVAEWKRSNPAKVCKITRAYETRNRRKRIANKRAIRAIQAGTISRPKACSKCGTVARLHAHHADYSKPLDVVFLCPHCHSKEHSKRKTK